MNYVTSELLLGIAILMTAIVIVIILSKNKKNTNKYSEPKEKTIPLKSRGEAKMVEIVTCRKTIATIEKPTQKPRVTVKKRIIYIVEYREETKSKAVLRIKTELDKNTDSNTGSLCLGYQNHRRCSEFHLDLKLDQINYIAVCGGNFLDLNVNPPDGALRVGSGRHSKNLSASVNHAGETACWGGSAYVSWRSYSDVTHAISYLKRYFDVRAHEKNTGCTQRFIDGVPHEEIELTRNLEERHGRGSHNQTEDIDIPRFEF